MKKNITLILLAFVTMGMLAGCGSRQLPQNQQQSSTVQTDTGSAEREAELQAEVDALRKELDALKNQTDQPQGEESAGQTDQGETSQGGTPDNTASVSKQGNDASSGASISIEEAKSIALARVPGASEKNISIELDYDDGWYVYEGEIMYDGMEYEFDIDGNSGTILKWEEERW